MSFWERRKQQIIAVGIVLLILIGIGYGLLVKQKEKEEVLLPPYEGQPAISMKDISESNSQNEEVVKIETIEVDVKGAVHSPGVYELETGLRVHHAIEMAGGAETDADLTQVNLAAYLNDGQVLYIPKVGEENLPWSGGAELSAQGKQKININTATETELTTLPGIGPSKAKAIITYREEHGPFKQLEDITKVNGIGQKSFEKLADHISIK